MWFQSRVDLTKNKKALLSGGSSGYDESNLNSNEENHYIRDSNIDMIVHFSLRWSVFSFFIFSSSLVVWQNDIGEHEKQASSS